MPLVAVSLFVASLIFANQDVGQYVATQLGPVVGPDATGEITNLLKGRSPRCGGLVERHYLIHDHDCSIAHRHATNRCVSESLQRIGAGGNECAARTPCLVAAVWTSVDGITWSRVPHDETVFGGGAGYSMGTVTVGGPGLVATGQDGRGRMTIWIAVAED